MEDSKVSSTNNTTESVQPSPTMMDRIRKLYTPERPLTNISADEGMLIAEYLLEIRYRRFASALVNLDHHAFYSRPARVYDALMLDERLPVHMDTQDAIIGPALIMGKLMANGVGIWAPEAVIGSK